MARCFGLAKQLAYSRHHTHIPASLVERPCSSIKTDGLTVLVPRMEERQPMYILINGRLDVTRPGTVIRNLTYSTGHKNLEVLVTGYKSTGNTFENVHH